MSDPKVNSVKQAFESGLIEKPAIADANNTQQALNILQEQISYALNGKQQLSYDTFVINEGKTKRSETEYTDGTKIIKETDENGNIIYLNYDSQTVDMIYNQATQIDGVTQNNFMISTETTQKDNQKNRARYDLLFTNNGKYKREELTTTTENYTNGELVNRPKIVSLISDETDTNGDGVAEVVENELRIEQKMGSFTEQKTFNDPEGDGQADENDPKVLQNKNNLITDLSKLRELYSQE